MKTTLLLPLLLLFCTFGYSQTIDSSSFRHQENNVQIDTGYVPYIVGSATMPGYDIKIMTCKDDASVTLKNGRKIAGLSCILSEGGDYVGGHLIFKDDTTIIKKITIVPIGKSGARFTVTGKDFEMSFTLENGVILAYEENCATFNTENIGIWTIVKKV